MKIVNKIVCFILAAAVFPLMITQVLVKIVLSINESSLAYTFLKLLLGEDKLVTDKRVLIEESVLDLFKLLTEKNDNSAFGIDAKTLLSSLPESFDKIKTLITVSGILVAAGLLITVVILGCILFTRAYKTIAALALSGSICFGVATLIFDKAAQPLLDGSVSLVDAIVEAMQSGESEGLGTFASGMLSDVIQVDTFTMGGAVFFAMFCLFGLAVWEFSYYITLPQSEKDKLKAKPKNDKKSKSNKKLKKA